ncbi:MAG: hypothetical protein MI923_16495 [Phycisphaerales bacterium]|nr:hypothetical protein [Phycisphaerales bacterium]
MQFARQRRLASVVLGLGSILLGCATIVSADGPAANRAVAERPMADNRIALKSPVQLQNMRYYRCSTTGSWSVEDRPISNRPPEGFELQAPAQHATALRGSFGCSGATTTVTHTDADFGGGSFNVQAGFGESEIAATSYTIPAGDFPIQIDAIEAIFAQQSAVVTTTTEWSVLVWEGTPDTGTLVAEFMSDDVVLPHLVLAPGTQGANILVQVDPGDPMQIVVNDNGTQTFSVGYRIDMHNNQTQNPCSVPPPSNSNAFPTTDVSGLSQSAQNWIFALNCPGPLSCAPGGGWFRFQDLFFLCIPSGDWVIRASYCAVPGSQIGACCEADTTCTSPIDDASCVALGGNFQGEGTDCGSVTCPNLFGACCRADGTCDDNDVLLEDCEGPGEIFSQDMTCAQVEPCPQPSGACCTDFGPGCVFVPEASCSADPFNGTWLGAFTDCVAGACDGACCNPTTGFCSIENEKLCNQFGSQFQGPGTACVGPSSDQCPTAACCLPDGMCMDLTVVDCDAQQGTYNDGEVCASFKCPQPLGACCLTSGGCLSDITQATCEGQGQTWAGPDTVCPGGCQQGCPGSDGDLNTDTTIDSLDIQGFVDCMLTGASSNPNVNCDCGDFDGMNGVDDADVPGMIGALLAP